MDHNIFQESLFFNNEEEQIHVVEPLPESRSYIATDSLSGQIIGAATDEEYHRLFFRKIYDKFAFGARMSDKVHSIIVRCQEGVVDRDVQVLCYGCFNGGVTAIRTGGDIQALGRFDTKNRFIAKSITVNNSHIEIKTEFMDLLVYTLPVLIILLPLIFSAIGSAVSGAAGLASSLAIPFIGGVIGTIHLMRKTRFFIPLRYRLKAGLIGGIVLALVVSMIMR